VEGVSSVQMVEKGIILSEWVSVGRGGQVSRLTDMLSFTKWPMDHFKCEVAGKGQATSVLG